MSKYKCEHCDFETDHNGAYNLHMYHCNLKRGVGVESKPKKKQSQCEHEWRLLTPSNPIESRALQSGYKEVCEKCQNVQ